MTTFAAIDVETANPSWGSACAVGIAVVDESTILHSSRFLVRPLDARFSPFNTSLHGISEVDVKDSPTLPELWPKLQAILQGKLIVAHNASFDMGVVRQVFKSHRLPCPEIEYLCSLVVSRAVWPNRVSYGLEEITRTLGIPLCHHNAKSGAIAAARLVLQACQVKQEVCARRLAGSLNIQIGHLYAGGQWLPCSRSSKQGKR